MAPGDIREQGGSWQGQWGQAERPASCLRFPRLGCFTLRISGSWDHHVAEVQTSGISEF